MKKRSTQKAPASGRVVSEIYSIIRKEDLQNWDYIASNPTVRHLEREACRCHERSDAAGLADRLREIQEFAANYDATHLAGSNAVVGEMVAFKPNNSQPHQIVPVKIVDKVGGQLVIDRDGRRETFRWSSSIHYYISRDGFLVRLGEES